LNEHWLITDCVKSAVMKQISPNPAVTDPKERARLFGQWDRVRAYGKDFVARLESGGFSVRPVTAAEPLTELNEAAEALQFKNEELFFCQKANGSTAQR
jgi:hypothetical protein